MVGLLWYDDSPNRDLRKKVALAVVAYRKKHREMPGVCYVHPSALNGNKKLRVGKVEVIGKRSVLRDHFWVGREEQPATKRSKKR